MDTSARTADPTGGDGPVADDIDDPSTVMVGPAEPATPSRRRFGIWLAAILAVALIIRMWCALGPMADRSVPTDAATIRTVAQTWADGHGLSVSAAPGRFVPTADHVPVHVTILTALDRVGLQDAPPQRVALGLLSLIGVAAMALIGRVLDRPAVGLVAAGIAAVSPIWFQPATNLMAEGIYLWVVPLALLAAVWCRTRPTWVRLVLMAVAIGFATLTRSEALLLVPTIALPVAWLSSRRWGSRLRALALVVGGFAVVVGPWLVRNHDQQGTWTLSTNQGGSLLGASCDPAFSGPRAGGWVAQCFVDGLQHVGTGVAGRRPTDGELSPRLQQDAVSYVKDHTGHVPGVVALRVGHVWGVARIADTLDYDVQEDRVLGLQEIGYVLNWALLALTAVGMALLSREEWKRWWIFVPPIVVATLAAAVFWGTPRFRTGAEPSLALFAAFAIVEGGGRLINWFWSGSRRRSVVTS